MLQVKIHKIIYWYSSTGFFWFRIFGVGLHIKNTKITGLSFSERIGKAKGLRIGKYRIKVLDKVPYELLN